MRLLSLSTALLLAGCPEEKPFVDAGPVIADAGAAAIDAGVPDAGPPVPTELAFAIDFVALDGGVSSVLSTAGTAQIDSARSVFILFPTPLKDYLEPQFRAAKETDASMVFRLQFDPPLAVQGPSAEGLIQRLTRLVSPVAEVQAVLSEKK